MEISRKPLNMAQPNKNYTQGILEEAVQLVRSKNMTLYGASKAFKIPLSTLGDKVRGRRAVNPQVKKLLTEEEEERLVQWIQVHAERSMRRTHDDIRQKVKEILDLRGASVRREDGRPGRDWVTSFKKRHPGLDLRSPQTLCKEQAFIGEQDVRDWFFALKEYLDSRDPALLKSPNRIFNADKTGFAFAHVSKRVLAPVGTKPVHNICSSTKTQTTQTTQTTVLVCASAAGEYVHPLLVFPRKRKPTVNLLAGFKDAYMQLSSNGFVNITIFRTFLKDIFIPFVADKPKPVVLFVDGHSSHSSDIGTLEMCEEHGIILYGLLPDASHIIQPLGLSVFGSMKARWSVVVKQHLDETGETPSAASFSHLLKKVWEYCARPEASLRGFRRSGIFPFNPESPLTRSFFSSPEGTSATPDIPQQIQTPPRALPPPSTTPSLSSVSTSRLQTDSPPLPRTSPPPPAATPPPPAATPPLPAATPPPPAATPPPPPTASPTPPAAHPSLTPATPSPTPTLQPPAATFPTQATPLPLAQSTSQASSAATALPQVATTRLDAVSSLLRLSSMVGITRCESYLEMLKERKTSEDKEFKEFQRVLEAAGVLEAQGQGILASSVPSSGESLDDQFALPRLPKNKGGTASKKTTSLTMAFSSGQNRNLQRKEHKARAEKGMKKSRKKDREEAKARKEQEKKERQEKSRVEKKKQEKKEAKERKQLGRLQNSKRKRGRESSSEEEEEEEGMVLESDDDVELAIDENRCKQCNKEEGDTKWIQCDLCGAWFHFTCSGLPSEAIAKMSEDFHCESCVGGVS
ncbi:uncharacterized protein LOC106011650 [Aplysia californica]|uniref:Uncharacterized protein LOC106011650 n=1 Tax=Aplysia californica TaxID=6500 RepID=A0ABM0ZZ35_APLCA|nr:uncharacterized protein LOC106011650 [Aplysia californica]